MFTYFFSQEYMKIFKLSSLKFFSKYVDPFFPHKNRIHDRETEHISQQKTASGTEIRQLLWHCCLHLFNGDLALSDFFWGHPCLLSYLVSHPQRAWHGALFKEWKIYISCQVRDYLWTQQLHVFRELSRVHPPPKSRASGPDRACLYAWDLKDCPAWFISISESITPCIHSICCWLFMICGDF